MLQKMFALRRNAALQRGPYRTLIAPKYADVSEERRATTERRAPARPITVVSFAACESSKRIPYTESTERHGVHGEY